MGGQGAKRFPIKREYSGYKTKSDTSLEGEDITNQTKLSAKEYNEMTTTEQIQLAELNTQLCEEEKKKNTKVQIQIKQLRKQGKKFAEISRITGKGIYYIYSRLNPKYRLRRSRYIIKKVTLYLKEKGLVKEVLKFKPELEQRWINKRKSEDKCPYRSENYGYRGGFVENYSRKKYLRKGYNVFGGLFRKEGYHLLFNEHDVDSYLGNGERILANNKIIEKIIGKEKYNKLKKYTKRMRGGMPDLFVYKNKKDFFFAEIKSYDDTIKDNQKKVINYLWKNDIPVKIVFVIPRKWEIT